MKDEFLASMSHELRTPLNAVLGVTSALEEGVYGSVNERQKRALDVITESGQHLLSLIADVLDLARLQAEQLSLRLAPVDLEEICAASLRLVQPSAQKRRIMLVSTRGGSTSMVVADARRLKQVLVNLLANAVKFTPEGGTVGLEVSSDEAERVVRFAVWDTGIGITPEDQARVFEPFVQVDSGLTRQYEGTGLGLALVTRLVALHGGTVAVESEPGQGSRFTITLPWRTPDPHDFARSAEQTAHTEHPGASPDTPRPLVLIVEDNTANSTLMSDYLRAYGLEVAVAKEGLEALREAKRLRPAVIVMDIQLPGMDGIEVTRRIKADASLGHTRVIAVTAMAMVGDRERCLEAGADDYLCKPVRLAELHTRVSELAMAGRRP
jgi:CheY-like chemotaxis protein